MEDLAQTDEEWESLVTRSFVPLTATFVAPSFSGSVRAIELPEQGSLSNVVCDGNQLKRDLNAPSDEDARILFVLHQRGFGQVTQYGREAQQRAGEAVLYMTDDEYTLTFPSLMDEIVVQLPAERLKTDLSRLRGIAATTFPSSPRLRALHAYVGSIMGEESRSLFETRHLQQNLALLIDDFLASLTDSRLKGNAEYLYDQARLTIWRNTYRANFDVDALAASLAVSRRKLYEIFEGRGETPGDAIRSSRLARVRHVLREHPQRSLERLAHESGFADARSLARAFVSEYGVTPAAWRRASSTPDPR